MGQVRLETRCSLGKRRVGGEGVVCMHGGWGGEMLRGWGLPCQAAYRMLLPGESKIPLSRSAVRFKMIHCIA